MLTDYAATKTKKIALNFKCLNKTETSFAGFVQRSVKPRKRFIFYLNLFNYISNNLSIYTLNWFNTLFDNITLCISKTIEYPHNGFIGLTPFDAIPLIVGGLHLMVDVERLYTICRTELLRKVRKLWIEPLATLSDACELNYMLFVHFLT